MKKKSLENSKINSVEWETRLRNRRSFIDIVAVSLHKMDLHFERHLHCVESHQEKEENAKKKISEFEVKESHVQKKSQKRKAAQRKCRNNYLIIDLNVADPSLPLYVDLHLWSLLHLSSLLDSVVIEFTQFEIFRIIESTNWERGAVEMAVRLRVISHMIFKRINWNFFNLISKVEDDWNERAIELQILDFGLSKTARKSRNRWISCNALSRTFAFIVLTVTVALIEPVDRAHMSTPVASFFLFAVFSFIFHFVRSFVRSFNCFCWRFIHSPTDWNRFCWTGRCDFFFFRFFFFLWTWKHTSSSVSTMQRTPHFARL